MKVNNTNNRNKQVRYPKALRKATNLLCIAAFITGVVGPAIIGKTPRIQDIIFYSAFGAGAILAWVTMRLTPNTEQYRCTSCGHIHIPVCRSTLRCKMHVHCPECDQIVLHKYVLPEKIANAAENR